MPTRKKRSWTQKLQDSKDLPRTFPLIGKAADKWGKGTMVIARPLDVDALMRQVPKGKLTTINHLRAALAKQHHADTACPITTGIFAWIAAHAAEESPRKPTPYWRTLKAGGQLNPKFPGGIPNLTKKLRAEGHTISHRGKNFYVKNFDQSLAQL